MKRESLQYPNQSNQNIFFNYKARKHKFKERKAQAEKDKQELQLDKVQKVEKAQNDLK